MNEKSLPAEQTDEAADGGFVNSKFAADLDCSKRLTVGGKRFQYIQRFL
ncbi:hypothetical protein OAH46_02895 [Verrucomicrobia bacterium]|nr:hypothetical protein [Verrucomicrobiota bacterium]